MKLQQMGDSCRSFMGLSKQPKPKMDIKTGTKSGRKLYFDKIPLTRNAISDMT